MGGLGSGHVTCGPMRGLKINSTQTDGRTDILDSVKTKTAYNALFWPKGQKKPWPEVQKKPWP